jgi:hypothetical protein
MIITAIMNKGLVESADPFSNKFSILNSNNSMKKNILSITLLTLFCGLFLTSCKKGDAVVEPDLTQTTLDLNTWKIDNTVYKLSAYGFGWASTDFSPRAGWTDYTTTTNKTTSIEVSFIDKPTASGAYTIENYNDVHLNKVRTTKITGNKVGIISTVDNTTYYSVVSATDKFTITVANGKTTLVFNKISLKDANSTKTIVVSGNLQY